MPPPIRPAVVVVAALAVALLGGPPAYAHGMAVTAELRPDDPSLIVVTVGYDTDDPADGATVRLLGGDGAEVARGTTDEAGVCRLPRPSAGRYKVVADDGSGHRTSIPYVVPDDPTGLASAASARRNRWVMAAAGLAAIAAVCVLARRFVRKPAPPAAPTVPPSDPSPEVRP